MHCSPRGTVSIENVSRGDPACNAVHMLSSALHFKSNCKTQGITVEALHMALITPHEFQVPPYCLLGAEWL